MIRLCRNDLRTLLTGNPNYPHPGLLLARGMTEWPAEGEGGGKAKKALIDKITRLKPSPLYRAALERWRKVTAEHGRFAAFQAELVGRLYIGVTRENALEAGVTTAHAYGMPMIPGSAVKGLCRATARRMKLGEQARQFMFGSDPPNKDNPADESREMEAGGLVFHDAWWVGKSEPFVAEIVTPHHQAYYKDGSVPASDFDSPIPANQIAVSGAFLFVIEGDPGWTGVAKRLLQMALADTGIGGKRSSGYGFFSSDTSQPGSRAVSTK